MATARKSSASGESRSEQHHQEREREEGPSQEVSHQEVGSQEVIGSSQSGEEERPAAKSAKPSAMKVARAAAAQLTELTGRRPEVVVGVERNDDGWQVELEVVESRRIPDSTDILATYRVQTDEDGEMLGYYRAQRYVRGKGGERG